MISCECLHCGEVAERLVSYDELGWHSSCVPCDSSFDVDIDGDYLVSLWPHDSDRAIDDITGEEKFEIMVEQFAFYKTTAMEECKELLQKLSAYDGMVYELHEVSSGKSIALGVFSSQSIYDDIWYADDHSEKMSGEHNSDTRPKAQAINGEVSAGDTVIVAPHDDYGHLIGEVIYIDKLGAPEHDTGNPGDDVHVNFRAFNYPPWQQIDFAEHFSELAGGEYRHFDDLPLDDVIIAPDALISLTGISTERINGMVTDFDEADSFCEEIMAQYGPALPQEDQPGMGMEMR